MTSETATAFPADDLDRVRQKYAEERDKRLRSDGTKQFIKLEGDFTRFTSDPFAPPPAPREALNEKVDIVIVGAGHCGLMAAVELVKAGRTNFLIVDSAADFGGTWYWNRYPGLRCDVDAYCYMPLLEEVGYVPKEKYASGVEIFENAQRIGQKFDLYDRALFQTHVRAARWDDEANIWTTETDRGDIIQSQFVIMALGPLNKPKLPGIPGLTDFKGHMFHTSRWDYGYTGGNPSSSEPDMYKLKDKRVGIVGTGCTSLQCAPRVANYAEHLYVIQRTPSAVNFRNNKPTDPEWAKALQPGWQERRIENFDRVMQGLPEDEDLVDDGWTAMSELMAATWASALNPDLDPDFAEKVDLEIMKRLRSRVEDTVEDPETAESLKAWYRAFCKRPTFSDHYLQMFNEDNATLLDTDGQGPERITANGIVVKGKEYELDCLIFASGYEVGTDYCSRGGLQIFGRDGVSLTEKWSTGMRTLYGYLTADFPNCFHMGIFLQNSAFGNFTSVFRRQAARVVEIMDRLDKMEKATIEPTHEAEEAWNDVIRHAFTFTESFHASCTPGYYNAEGKPSSGEGIQFQQFSGGVTQFEEIAQDWMDRGMPGVKIN